MQTTTKRTARIGAVVLASCVGAGALFAASPALALDGLDIKGVGYTPHVSISKTDAETGEKLDGAVFRVEVMNPDRFFTGPLGYYDRVDPSTWTFASAADIPYTTVEEVIQYEIDRHNAGLAANQTMIDALLAKILPADVVAAHEATVAEWQSAVDAAAPFSEAVSAANAERQRLADEIIALQNAGQPVPIGLAQAHADAQQAQADAIAAAQPYRDAVDALAGGAQQARSALDASAAAQRELNAKFPGGYLPWTVDNHGVNTADFENALLAWIEGDDALRAAGLAQAACNAQWGVSTAPTDLGGGVFAYDIATCDGVATLPIGSYPLAVTEVVAPEGYVLDDTRYETPPTSESTFEFNGERISYRDGVLQITNEPVEPLVEPPVEPPVTPPAEPPVETPPAPPETPEKLAVTGGSGAPIGILAAAGGLLAAGAGALALRNRRSA